MKETLQIPDELRAFLREVAAKLDWEDRAALVGPEALECECARGGRLEGGDAYRFTYFARDGHGRFEIVVREQEIRDIAAGLVDELLAEAHAPDTRTARGEPLLVWGEYAEDALRIRSSRDLEAALDALHAISMNVPCTARLWSSADDQAFVALNGDECAIYVVTDYGTSVGDARRTDGFELVDHDTGQLAIPGSDCIPWSLARPALLGFVDTGQLGEVQLEGRIPSQLLSLGDFDRATMLATRRNPTADPALSSLPGRTPYGSWAERLLGGLIELSLIEIDTSIRDDITARLSMLLLAHGDDAQDQPEPAQKLAKELARLRGVGALFATAGDLQIALRRTQDPPTQPVEIPLS